MPTCRHIILGSLLVLFSLPALAEDPPSDSLRQFIQFKDTLGAFDYYDSDQIPDNAASSLNNLDFSITGGLRRRRNANLYVDLTGGGDGWIGSFGGARNQSFWIYKTTATGGGRPYFIARIDGELDHAPLQNFIFETEFDQKFSTGQVEALQADGNFYMVSEVTPIVKITDVAPPGSSAAPLKLSYIQNSPSGRMLRSHLDRYLVAGATDFLQRNVVFFSSGDGNSPDITTWPKSFFFEINAKSDEYITCMGDALFGNVPLYTNRTVRLITGSAYPDNDTAGNIVVRTIYDGIGCASQRSVKNVRNQQYFYSSGQDGRVPGIYTFNGVSIKEKTKSIRRFFENNVQNSTATLATAFVYKDQYCLNVATIGVEQPATIVCLDEQDRPFFMKDRSILMMDDFGGQNYFLFTNGAQQYHIGIYDATDGQDHFVPANPAQNQPIRWNYKTKDFAMGQANDSRPKTPERIYLKTQVTTGTMGLDLTARYDFGKSSTVWHIDLSTIYTAGDIVTVSSAAGHLINRIKFPTGKQNLDFNYINFELSGSTVIAVDYLDFYALRRPLK